MARSLSVPGRADPAAEGGDAPAGDHHPQDRELLRVAGAVDAGPHPPGAAPEARRRMQLGDDGRALADRQAAPGAEARAAYAEELRLADPRVADVAARRQRAEVGEEDPQLQPVPVDPAALALVAARGGRPERARRGGD